MTSTQLQLRGDTKASLEAVVLAIRELGIDITDFRIRIGDNVTEGGIILPNRFDIQENIMVSGVAGGTANALTLALTPPIEDYEKFASVIFEAASNNTGSATINIDGNGALTMKKRTSAGLVNLEADDLIDGGIYRGVYDGTYLQIESLHAVAGITSVSQGNLNTNIGTFSATPAIVIQGELTGGIKHALAFASSAVVMPGGQYGLWPEVAASLVSYRSAWVPGTEGTSYVNAAYALMFDNSSQTVYGRQRYITSSAPWTDAEGKEAAGFFYLLLNEAEEIVSHYLAEAPPWGYNGPTSVRADRICPKTKKKFRTILKKRSIEEIMDGANLLFDEEEITPEVKRRDMNSLPHPFGKVPTGHSVIMLDTRDDRIHNLIRAQSVTGGDDILEEIRGGKFSFDTEALNRKGPGGLSVFPMKYKYTGRGRK